MMTHPLTVAPLVFKFHSSSLQSATISYLSYIVVLAGSIAYTHFRFGTSSAMYSYGGLQIQEAPNVSCLLFMLPPPNFTNQLSILQLKIVAPRNATLSLDAELSCQWYRRPSQAVIPVQRSGGLGVNRIFSTGLFSYDSILSQVHISGDVQLVKSVEVLYVMGSPDFSRETFAIRWICSASSFACLVIYCISLGAFLRTGIQVEQILAVGSLLLSAAANLPIEFSNQRYRNLGLHCCDSFFQGLFGSYNTVSLFLFVFRLNGGKVIGFAFLMSLLFIVANAIQIVTGDTRILNLVFDGNMDIWMFFVSASVMGRIGLFVLQIYHGIFPYCCSRSAKSHVNAAYCVGIALEIVTSLLQGAVYYVDGHGNFALDFFGDYLLQTIFAFVFADIHWPAVPPVRKTSLMAQHVGTGNLQFLPADQTDRSIQPQFCL
jgi:hypothetical protein